MSRSIELPSTMVRIKVMQKEMLTALKKDDEPISLILNKLLTNYVAKKPKARKRLQAILLKHKKELEEARSSR